MVNIKAYNATDLLVVEEPTMCPICLHSIVPVRTSAYVWQFKGNKIAESLDAAYFCPHSECGRMFIGRYQRRDHEGRSLLVHYDSQPKVVLPPTIDPEILQISPDFADIYSQARAAEDYSLSGIAGVGYRKAVEFLIKDYCIKKHPESDAEIKRKFLGGVIRDYVDDANVKQCAKLAVWLGNDETHYERKFNDKDIDDLKMLIRLTCNWIINEVLTNRYTNEMEKRVEVGSTADVS